MTSANLIKPAITVQLSRKFGRDELNRMSGTAASETKIASKGTIDKFINRSGSLILCDYIG
jgi:hypothetical protein